MLWKMKYCPIGLCKSMYGFMNHAVMLMVLQCGLILTGLSIDVSQGLGVKSMTLYCKSEGEKISCLNSKSED